MLSSLSLKYEEEFPLYAIIVAGYYFDQNRDSDLLHGNPILHFQAIGYRQFYQHENEHAREIRDCNRQHTTITSDFYLKYQIYDKHMHVKNK